MDSDPNVRNKLNRGVNLQRCFFAMFNGDRGIIFALIGWLAFASFISWDAAEEQKPEIYCSKGGQPSDCRPQQYATERAFIPSGFERAISNPEPSTGQDHEKRDLAAQEASAVFTFWMAMFAGFGTLVTTLATILLYQQIKLTRQAVEDTGNATIVMEESNKIAREIGQAQAASYLHVEDVKFFISEKGKIPHVKLTVCNVGNSPALMPNVNIKIRGNSLNAAKLVKEWGPTTLCSPASAIAANKSVAAGSVAVQFSDAAALAYKTAAGATLFHIICSIELHWTDVFRETRSFEEKFSATLDKNYTDGSDFLMPTVGRARTLLISELRRRGEREDAK